MHERCFCTDTLLAFRKEEYSEISPVPTGFSVLHFGNDHMSHPVCLQLQGFPSQGFTLHLHIICLLFFSGYLLITLDTVHNISCGWSDQKKRQVKRVKPHCKPSLSAADSPAVESPPALRAVLCQGFLYCLLCTDCFFFFLSPF